MRRNIEWIGSVGALLVLAFVAGCSGSVRPGGSSTVQGTITAASGAPAAGVLATVRGSGLSAVTDAAGQFSLQGAEEGPATLELSGRGAKASVAVPRLGGDLVVRLSVRLSDDGSSAELLGEPEAELSGAIDSIAAPDLVVAGHTVHTDAQTAISVAGAAATLADLKAGEAVEVEGVEQSDGSVLARKIKADVEHAPESGVELHGAIDSIAAPDLSVGGKSVHTDASTRFELDGQPATLLDLKAGEQVEVKGALQADGSVLASRIEALSVKPTPPEPPASEVELHGKVEAISGGDLTVAGHLVHTGTLTIVRGHGAHALADVKVGAAVEVRGALQADGSTLASRIDLED